MKVFKVIDGEHYYYGKYPISSIGEKMFELGKIFPDEIFVEEEPTDSSNNFEVKTSIDNINWNYYGCYNKKNLAYAMFSLGKMNSAIFLEITEKK